MPLADVQAGVRRALVEGDASAVEALLVGGADPRRRLAIHARHYTSSLVTALLDRFPATVWLAGSAPVTAAARAFVRACPPSRPCIAEYGGEFPSFLSGQPDTRHLAYLGPFSELEWHLGRLSLAVDAPAVTDLSTLDPGRLLDTSLQLQPGVHYLHLDWNLDELIALFLTDRQPDTFVLTSADTWLELRGARGELRFSRVTGAAVSFRTALAGGRTLGAAAVAALEADPAFDVTEALSGLFAEGLVTGTAIGSDREDRHA